MRTRKVYPTLARQTFRPEVTTCVSCGARWRRRLTLSRRVVITGDGPVQVTHCGYRCPNPACAGARRTYRSAVADGLALPGFTFGLDWILLIGRLRLSEHLTLDQTHQAVQERLARSQVTISRREVLYLFEAYCSLLRAAQDWSADPPWRAEVEANGGVLLALDGIQPDKGHETIYLLRDVLSGHLLGEQNLLSSETRVIQEELLAPIVAWGVPVLGVLTDGQESLLQAVAATWPGVPHQICTFTRCVRRDGSSMSVTVRSRCSCAPPCRRAFGMCGANWTAGWQSRAPRAPTTRPTPASWQSMPLACKR
jgi:hypothetical protein